VSREKLKKAIGDREAHRMSIPAARDALDSEYKEAIVDAARRKYPRRKYSADNLKKVGKDLGDEHEKIYQAFQEKARALVEQQASETKRLKELVTSIASKLKPRRGSERFTYASHWISTYRSQGYGAERYTGGLADIDLGFVESHGIEAAVVHDSNGLDSYDVLVMVEDSIDVEILKAQDFSIRDFLKACWSRALDPRVFNPYLPHGLEEKLGIDFQGRDTR
jgi:hypothetical protein